ncbi:leucine-rich repeat domain-containing protein [Sporosarcina sp. PTS2304]|uniref:leucine-rich repeat domain-containing protein n=1 Tax=Sporosarcina sp. PTS2304 TaxID=2283194 RepID=UPI0013B3F1D4|nr:leucine-rich repeat domain-containing protein [Sporosarcina sp. PTS2304]
MNKFMTILLILLLVFSNMPSVGAMPIEPRFDTTELSDGTLMITKYNGTETEVDIPSELGGRLITNIGSAAFYSRNLTRITIPDSVKFIGSSAFGSNSLTTVHIPEGVRTIGPYAFYSNKLTEVSIPDNVTSIEERAFQMNQLTNVELLGNDLIIGDFAFANNKLTSISIANGVKKIGESAFRYNRLTSIEIPGSVETIGQFAFSGSFNGLENELTDVKIQNGVKSIGSNAFFIGSLTSVTIPESVENLDSSAFAYHLLEEVTFEGNPTIGSYGLDQAGPRYKEFKGWYTDEEFTSEWNGTSVPEGKKLYGKRLPAPPQEVSAVKGLEEATVSFTGPTHMGGNAVTNYSVKVYIDGIEQIDGSYAILVNNY